MILPVVALIGKKKTQFHMWSVNKNKLIKIKVIILSLNKIMTKVNLISKRIN